MAGQIPVAIDFVGLVPTKKNQRAHGWTARGVRQYIPRAVETQLNALCWQARAQWRGRPPLEHPALVWIIEERYFGKDRDNLKTTLLDVLVEARVLADDNIAHCNGWEVTKPATRGAQRTRVLLLAADHDFEAQLARLVGSREELLEKREPPGGGGRVGGPLESQAGNHHRNPLTVLRK